jgi:hypothetical protein
MGHVGDPTRAGERKQIKERKKPGKDGIGVRSWKEDPPLTLQELLNAGCTSEFVTTGGKKVDSILLHPTVVSSGPPRREAQGSYSSL